ncbi:hypothetical protein U1Q18_051586 [Sarracenia purpurea var. burkii]
MRAGRDQRVGGDAPALGDGVGLVAEVLQPLLLLLDDVEGAHRALHARAHVRLRVRAVLGGCTPCCSRRRSAGLDDEQALGLLDGVGELPETAGVDAAPVGGGHEAVLDHEGARAARRRVLHARDMHGHEARVALLGRDVQGVRVKDQLVPGGVDLVGVDDGQHVARGPVVLVHDDEGDLLAEGRIRRSTVSAASPCDASGRSRWSMTSRCCATLDVLEALGLVAHVPLHHLAVLDVVAAVVVLHPVRCRLGRIDRVRQVRLAAERRRHDLGDLNGGGGGHRVASKQTGVGVLQGGCTESAPDRTYTAQQRNFIGSYAYSLCRRRRVGRRHRRRRRARHTATALGGVGGQRGVDGGASGVALAHVAKVSVLARGRRAVGGVDGLACQGGALAVDGGRQRADGGDGGVDAALDARRDRRPVGVGRAQRRHRREHALQCLQRLLAGGQRALGVVDGRSLAPLAQPRLGRLLAPTACC